MASLLVLTSSHIVSIVATYVVKGSLLKSASTSRPRPAKMFRIVVFRSLASSGRLGVVYWHEPKAACLTFSLTKGRLTVYPLGDTSCHRCGICWRVDERTLPYRLVWAVRMASMGPQTPMLEVEEQIFAISRYRLLWPMVPRAAALF